MSDIWTPGGDLPPRSLERSVAPGALLRDSQIALTSGLATTMERQTALLAEAVKALTDMKVSLAAQATYATSPATAAGARLAMAGVDAASRDFVPSAGPPIDIPHRMPRIPRLVEEQRLRPASEHVSTDAARGVMRQGEDVRVATYAAGRQQGIKGVRQVVANRVARAVSEVDFGGDYYEGLEVPADFPVTPGQPLPAEFINIPEGVETQTVYRDRETGNVLDAVQAASAARAISRATAVRSVVNAVGQGQGLSAGVQAAAPRLAAGLGYAGLAVGAIQQGYQMYTGQLAANRPYQQVLGGGINEGFGERFSQNVFRLRNALSFNPIGSAESEAIYQGALQTYAGDRNMRGEAQQAMSDLYRSTGMSPQQSLQVIQIAAKEGNTALDQLARSLKQVTETAREAGINAEEARDRFTQTYATLAQTIGGPGAAALASSQTQAITSLGLGYQGLGIDTSQTRMMVIGALNGMSPGEIQNEATLNPMGFAQMEQTHRTNEAQRLLGNIGAREEIAAYLQRVGKPTGQGLTKREMDELGAIVNRRARSPELAQQMAGMAGITGTTTANAGEALVLASMGLPDTAGQMEEDMAELGTSDFSISAGDSAIGSKANQARRNDQERLLKDMGFSGGDIEDILRPGTSPRGKKGAAKRYLAQVEQTGQRSGVLERLIKEYDKDRRYAVHTSGGERVVGNFELIEGFADQAQAGDVDIVKGSGTGNTIEGHFGADLQGYAEDAESASEKWEGKTFGSDLPDWAKKKLAAQGVDVEALESGRGIGGAGGAVTINAGPELRRWIEISTTGSAYYSGQRTGTPPTGIPYADERATGG